MMLAGRAFIVAVLCRISVSYRKQQQFFMRIMMGQQQWPMMVNQPPELGTLI
jgi:hypothetical protein